MWLCTVDACIAAAKAFLLCNVYIMWAVEHSES